MRDRPPTDALTLELERLRGRVAELEAELRRQHLDVAPPASFFDSMFEGVQVLAFDWTYLYLNSMALQHARRGRDELLGRRIMDMYPGIEQTAVFERMRRCMAERTPERMLNHFAYPDGKDAWFELRIAPVPVGILVLSIDVTDQKATEQALLRSREDLETTLQCMRDAVITTDPAGLITRMNPAAEALTGWSLAQTHGQPLESFVRFLRDDDTPVENTVRRVLRDGLRMGLANTTVLLRRDGGKVPIATSGAPMRDAQGALTGVVMVIKDVSEEHALMSQLQQAQKMEAVGRLAGGVAHDFNNLLTAIFSFGKFVLDALRPADPAYADMQEVLKAAERAETLTRQLLAFSRRQTVRPRVLNINEQVSNVDRMVRRILGEDIEFSTSLGADLWNVKIDPSALEQVLVNLAVNARDAMQGGGKLTLETANVTLDDTYGAAKGTKIAAGDYVCMAVSDNGAGMDNETLRHIFEPFFTTKEAGKGTGLGLSTCYGIVSQAGGYIWVYSELGKGTTFKVYLPRALAKVEQDSATVRALDARGAETVLVAEDDAQVRALVVRTLQRYGYNVLTAETGGDALLHCEKHPGRIALLLTDVVMPRMGGKELAARAAALRPGLKVLYMSGYTENAIVHQGVLQEGVQLIQKPFAPEALALRVREILASGTSHHDAAPARRRILVVDDDAAILRSTKNLLSDAYHVVLASNGVAALDLIAVEHFDLILCDIVMPDMPGNVLYERVRSTFPSAAERFVFVTSAVGVEFVDAFLSQTDRPKLTKPIDVDKVATLLH